MGENQEHYPRDLRGYAGGAAARALAGRGADRSAVCPQLRGRRGESRPAWRCGFGTVPVRIIGAASYPARHMSMDSLYEYGSRAGFWRIHREFSQRGLPLTVFGVAMALARHPESCGGDQGCGLRCGQPRLALDPLSAHGYCRGARASAKSGAGTDRPVRQTAHRLVYRPRQPLTPASWWWSTAALITTAIITAMIYLSERSGLQRRQPAAAPDRALYPRRQRHALRHRPGIQHRGAVLYLSERQL